MSLCENPHIRKMKSLMRFDFDLKTHFGWRLQWSSHFFFYYAVNVDQRKELSRLMGSAGRLDNPTKIYDAPQLQSFIFIRLLYLLLLFKK